MKRAALALCGATVLLLAGCSADVNESTNVSPATHVEIASSPATPYSGYPVTVTVTAHNERLVIRTVAVDFTDDGTMDETRSFDALAVTATFTNVFPAAGTYVVRAAVTDVSGATTSTSLEVAVTSAPPTVPVTLVVLGTSPQDGRCFAAGPPVTCPGCAVLIGTSTPLPLTMSLGEQPRGFRVTVEQEFNQWPVAFNDRTYECDFRLRVLAGAEGQQRVIASRTCETSSLTQPVTLDCRISVTAVVP